MKSLFFLLLLITPTLLFSQEKMRLSGVIKNYPFDALFVRGDIPESKSFFDDTIKVSNGRFYYEREVDGALHLTFVVKNMLGKFIVYASNETIDIEVDYQNLKQPIIKKSKTNDDYNLVIERHYDKMSDLRNNENKKNFLSAITTDTALKDNIAVPYFIYGHIDFTDYQSAESTLKRLSKMQHKTVYAKHMLTILKQAKYNVVGAKAYNFDLYDLSGKRYRLSDFKGKHVLLDFSASWCGWCKKEIPYIKEAYEYGKDQGLVVITVNLDTKRELWEKDSDVPWMTLSDLKAFESETTKGYNIGGIPQIYIIDKAGRIISRDLRGDKLVNYIKQIL